MHTRSAGAVKKYRSLVNVRLLLYLVAVGFVLQRMYLYANGPGELYSPRGVIAALLVILAINFSLVPFMAKSRRIDAFVTCLFISDLIAITCVVLASGGFKSIFITYYLLILVISSLSLPRRYTAIFPSVATLGIAVVGGAHLIADADGGNRLFTRGYSDTLADVTAPAVVADMLLLALLFFIVAYLAGVVGDNLTFEQRLNAEILANMVEGVAFMDNKGTLVYGNPEFHRLFPGAARANGVDAFAQAVLGASRNGLASIKAMTESSGEAFIATSDRDEKQNRPPVEIRVSKLFVEGGGKKWGLFFLATDLSPRLRIEAAERSVERFSAISTMAAGLAHEIRNPLASVRSAMQEISAIFLPGSQNRTLVDLVMAESDRLDGIIGRFLNFSRDEPLALSRVRVGRLLEDVKTLVERSGHAPGAEIRLVIEDDPGIVCDADRLKEAFLNLGLNAAQFLPRQNGRLVITLGETRERLVPGVAIEFLDNGPGIDPADMANIFAPFFSRRDGGTGMGLAFARKQIEAHGGVIDAENAPGGGGLFRIWLPLVAGEEDAAVDLRKHKSITRVYRLRSKAD